MSEEDLFRELMDDVVPLADAKAQKKVPGAQKVIAGDVDARRRSALGENQKGTMTDPNFLTLGEVPAVAPNDLLDWKKDGVQEGVHRKLRLGKYPIDARLDLHRHTVKEARSALFAFLNTALQDGLRTVLILHGKGELSPTPARLKSYTASWLTQFPQVIAFHTAQRHHGSYGAVYALLQKTEMARQDNRERHGRKGNPEHTR